MPYRLDSSERSGDALRRAAAEQLDRAVSALEADGAAPAATDVHTARKSLKKTRSALRLARPALGKAAFRRENAALGDAGRLLSGTRDADVMVASTAALAERYAGRVPAATFEALGNALAAHAVQQRAAGDGDRGSAAEQAREAIAEVRERAAAWPLDDLRQKTLVAGLRRTYERGRDALSAVRAGGDAEASHAWRKRVKDLWYQQRLVAPAWPEILEAQAEQAHALSELLGDDHDLVVLRDHIATGQVAVAADLAPVHEIVEQRHAELVDEALRLGARVYAESPKAYERRIRSYLKAWRTEQGATDPAPT